MFRRPILAPALFLIAFTIPARGQDRFTARPPEFASTQVSAERTITFRVFAPKASSVRLASSDLPAMNRAGLEMKKAENGVWEVTTEVVPAGAYRYNFNVDGLAVLDPRNPATSESNTNSWSLVTVPEALKQRGIEVTYQETDSGHTWLNWRDYLHEFAPLLFSESL